MLDHDPPSVDAEDAVAPASSQDVPALSSDDLLSAASRDVSDDDADDVSDDDDDATDAAADAGAPNRPRRRYAWSPETETRPEVRALLARRSALSPEEVLLLRQIYSLIYTTYFETLAAVVYNCGANENVKLELMHDAYLKLFERCIDGGMPEKLQSTLLGIGAGLTRNHVKHERLNPATQALPTSSKEAPGSFPKPYAIVNLQQVAVALFDRLSERHRQVVEAVVIDDMTVAAAARLLKMKRTTLSSQLSAALARLDEASDELLTESARDLS